MVVQECLKGILDLIKGVQLLDDERALYWSRDSTLRLWNLKDGSSKVLEGHTDRINGVQLLDGERALSYSIDSTLRLWNLKDGSSKVFKGHTDRDLGSSSAGWRKSIVLWAKIQNFTSLEPERWQFKSV